MSITSTIGLKYQFSIWHAGPIHGTVPIFSKVALFSGIAISVVFSRRTNKRAVNGLDTAVILKVERRNSLERVL
jgi:hypothetical protein